MFSSSVMQLFFGVTFGPLSHAHVCRPEPGNRGGSSFEPAARKRLRADAAAADVSRRAGCGGLSSFQHQRSFGCGRTAARAGRGYFRQLRNVRVVPGAGVLLHGDRMGRRRITELGGHFQGWPSRRYCCGNCPHPAKPRTASGAVWIIRCSKPTGNLWHCTTHSVVLRSIVQVGMIQFLAILPV